MGRHQSHARTSAIGRLKYTIDQVSLAVGTGLLGPPPGLELTDRIDVNVTCAAEAARVVAPHEAAIRHETLTRTLSFAPPGSVAGRDWDVNGYPVQIRVEPI